MDAAGRPDMLDRPVGHHIAVGMVVDGMDDDGAAAAADPYVVRQLHTRRCCCYKGLHAVVYALVGDKNKLQIGY